MAAKVLLVFTCILAWVLLNANGQQMYQHPPSMPPTPSCSALIFKMADCLPYLSKGSNVSKPEGSCCTGFKTVVKTDFKCICEALKSSAQLGVDIDMSKAAKLPSSCGDKSTRLSSCFSAGAPRSPPPGPHHPPSKPPTPATKPPTPSHHHVTPIKHAPKPSPFKAPAPAPAPASAAHPSTSLKSVFTYLCFAIVPCFFILA